MQPANPDPSLQRITLAMVLVNAFATPLMLSAVNVALPAIARDLSMSAVTLGWVPLAYLMASAMFVLVFGRLADMFGRRRIFLLGTASVIVTSVMAALSVSAEMLVAARFLQGVSAAMLYATQVALVSSVYPPSGRGRAIGLTISMIYLGLAAGPVAGGFIVDLFGWRACFLLHIPLGVAALVIGLLFVKQEWSSGRRGGVDIFGAAVYAVSIFILCIAVSRLPGIEGGVLSALALSGIVFFFLFEHRHRQPLLDVSLFFTNRVFTFSCLASLMIYTATFVNVVQVSLYLQYLKGLTATTAGFIMVCQPVTMALFSPLAGRLSDRFEPRHIATAGVLVCAVALCLLANLSADTPISYLLAALFLTGLGFGFFSSPNVNAIISSVERKQLGSANAVVATMRIVGQMGSMVLVTLVFALSLGTAEIQPDNYPVLEKSIRTIFSIAAFLCLPAFCFSMARGRLHQSP